VTGAEASSFRDVTQAEARLAAEGLATEPQPGDLLLGAARQRAGARSRWAGLGVSRRPGAYRDTMISLLPRRLRTADPREGHRPGVGVGGLGPPGRYRPDAVLADAGRDGHRGRGGDRRGSGRRIGCLARVRPGQGIEVMASIILIRRSLGPGRPERRAQQLMAVSFLPLAPFRFIPSPVPRPHGSGPWADRLGFAWGDG
jgi:hypothetical protein